MVAVATAVAGGCGENAADREAEAGSVTEFCRSGGAVRAVLALHGRHGYYWAVHSLGGRTGGHGRVSHQPFTENCWSVIQSHGRAMTTRLVDPSRTSVVRSHSKVMQVTLMLPPPLFRTEKQLTARRDRPVRDPARAVGFTTTAAAIGGAGSVHRRTGMRSARALPGDRNRPGSPPATDCRQNPPPALPVNHIRCSADHRPAWRCDVTVRSLLAEAPSATGEAGISRLPRRVFPSVPRSNCRSRLDTRPARTPVNAAPPLLRAAAHDSGPPWVATTTLPVLTGAREVQNDTQRTLCARGVSPGEPGESRAARF